MDFKKVKLEDVPEIGTILQLKRDRTIEKAKLQHALKNLRKDEVLEVNDIGSKSARAIAFAMRLAVKIVDKKAWFYHLDK